MNPFIHIICDYAPGDLAWAEVVAAVHTKLPGTFRYHLSPVDSFQTIATGFVVAQLALADTTLRPDPLFVFANCAPRHDRNTARAANEGEGLVYGLLSNGVKLLVVNSGSSLSFVKEDLIELWSVHVEERGSQFRSRDFFPQVLAELVQGNLSIRKNTLPIAESIPDKPYGVIGYVDSFGNLKTTYRSGDDEVAALEPGQRIRVIVGNTVRTATVVTGSFNVHQGDLAFAPGSSGHGRRYWELFKRGSSAWDEFAKPKVGDRIHLEVERSYD